MVVRHFLRKEGACETAKCAEEKERGQEILPSFFVGPSWSRPSPGAKLFGRLGQKEGFANRSGARQFDAFVRFGLRLLPILPTRRVWIHGPVPEKLLIPDRCLREQGWRYAWLSVTEYSQEADAEARV